MLLKSLEQFADILRVKNAYLLFNNIHWMCFSQLIIQNKIKKQTF
jgi:hypothetical protein